MTIKLIDTYDRAVVEPLGIIREDLLHDRSDFAMFPANSPVREFLQQQVADGHLPSTLQPEDSIVWTDTECIVTVVWNEYYNAQNYSIRKLGQNVPGLKSSVVVEED